MSERIDILVAAKNQASAVAQQVSSDFRAMGREVQSVGAGSSAIDAVAGSLGGLGGILAGGAIISGLRAIGDELVELGRRGAIFDQLGDVLEDFAASVGGSADEFVQAGQKAAQGTISSYDLILNANRAIQFEVAQTAEQYAQLIELSTALGRAQGISDATALDFITTGIARESRLILDNLGLIIDLDDATKKYAESLGKKADQLTQAERKQAILAEAYRQGKVAIQANRDAAESAATQFERFDAEVQNLRDTFGAWVADNSAGYIGILADEIARINDALNVTNVERAQTQLMEFGSDITELATRIQNLQAIAQSTEAIGNFASADAAKTKIQELSFQIVALANNYNKAAEITGAPLLDVTSVQQGIVAFESEEQAALRAAAALQETAVASQQAGMEAQFLAAASQDGAAGLSVLEAMAWSTGAAVDQMSGAMARATLVAAKLGAVRGAALARAEGLALRAVQAGGDPTKITTMYGEMADQIENMGLNMDLTNVSMLENKILVQAASAEYDGVLTGIIDADKEAQKLARSTGSVGSAARDAGMSFDALQSKVAGVLSGSLSLDVGVDTEAILGREDAINEDARRLADVAVRGFDSPWAQYLKDKFPDTIGAAFEGADPKQAAAQLLRDFEDGLRPELLDKEAAKERVRRALVGDANMAALASEIAAELSAEFGGSINLGRIQAVAGTTLGVDGAEADQLKQTLASATSGIADKLSGLGGSLKSGIISALEGVGEAVASAIDKQFRAEGNLKLVREAGAVNGEAWGSGFLDKVGDNVPAKLIEILATLVTPNVVALLNRNATLQGAN